MRIVFLVCFAFLVCIFYLGRFCVPRLAVSLRIFRLGQVVTILSPTLLYTIFTNSSLKARSEGESKEEGSVGGARSQNATAAAEKRQESHEAELVPTPSGFWVQRATRWARKAV